MCEPGLKCPTHCPTPAAQLELTGAVWPLLGAVGAVGVGVLVVQHFSAAAIGLAALAAVATVVITIRSMAVALRASERRRAPVSPAVAYEARLVREEAPRLKAKRTRPRPAGAPVRVSAWASDLQRARKRQLQIEAARAARVEAQRRPQIEARPALEPTRIWTSDELARVWPR